jgi:hypothetical protein
LHELTIDFGKLAAPMILGFGKLAAPMALGSRGRSPRGNAGEIALLASGRCGGEGRRDFTEREISFANGDSGCGTSRHDFRLRNVSLVDSGSRYSVSRSHLN